MDILITDINIESLFNLAKLLALLQRIPQVNYVLHKDMYLQVSNLYVLLEIHFKLTLYAPFSPQLMIATICYLLSAFSLDPIKTLLFLEDLSIIFIFS